MTPPALCLVRGLPTARLPSRLRENLGNKPSVWRPWHVAGERLATVKGHPGYTVWQHCSLLDRDPPRIWGWGRKRKAEYCLVAAEVMEMSKQRLRACLQQGLRLDLNLLVRRGLIAPGSATGPHAIRWVNSDGEVIASGWVSAEVE